MWRDVSRVAFDNYIRQRPFAKEDHPNAMINSKGTIQLLLEDFIRIHTEKAQGPAAIGLGRVGGPLGVCLLHRVEYRDPHSLNCPRLGFTIIEQDKPFRNS